MKPVAAGQASRGGRKGTRCLIAELGNALSGILCALQHPESINTFSPHLAGSSPLELVLVVAPARELPAGILDDVVLVVRDTAVELGKAALDDVDARGCAVQHAKVGTLISKSRNIAEIRGGATHRTHASSNASTTNRVTCAPLTGLVASSSSPQ